MKRPRCRWYAWVACGLVAVPPLFWILIVLIAPTDWARRRVVSRLEARSGRKVALEGVSVGLFGGIHLKNLEIGSPRDTAYPWLKAADIHLDFGPWRMLQGRCRPSEIDVDGVAVRVLRRADGKVELADLVRPVPAPGTGRGGSPAATEPRVAVRVRNARVLVVDEPSRTHLTLEDVEGEGYGEGPLAVVEQLRGTMNGGAFRFAARIDRTAKALSAEVQLRAEDVALDEGMAVLRYVVPVLAGASTAVKGRVAADVYFSGRGPTWPVLCRKLAGHGEVALNPVELVGTPLVAEISRFADLKGTRKLGSLHTDFVYKDQRITTDHFNMMVGRVPITMSGWTDLDGRIDYELKVEGLRERLPDQARRILGELKVDLGSLTVLNLRGTVDRVAMQVNGVSIDHGLLRDARLRPDDREKIRRLSRKLTEGLLR
jgi:autotransporter translocation and assembly factor TamB